MSELLVHPGLRIDQAAINLYAEMSDDFNPIHVDPAFAATTPMGGVIAHGTLSLALLWQALAGTFGHERTCRARMQVRFLRPVRVGDHVIPGGRFEDEDAGKLTVWVRNQHQEDVILGCVEIPVSDISVSPSQS